MDQQTLLTVMTAFVIIAAVALIIQAAMLAGIYKTSRGLQENVQRLLPKIESVLETSRQTIDDSRKQIADITSKTSEILETKVLNPVRRVQGLIDRGLLVERASGLFVPGPNPK